MGFYASPIESGKQRALTLLGCHGLRGLNGPGFGWVAVALAGLDHFWLAGFGLRFALKLAKPFRKPGRDFGHVQDTADLGSFGVDTHNLVMPADEVRNDIAITRIGRLQRFGRAGVIRFFNIAQPRAIGFLLNGLHAIEIRLASLGEFALIGDFGQSATNQSVNNELSFHGFDCFPYALIPLLKSPLAMARVTQDVRSIGKHKNPFLVTVISHWCPERGLNLPVALSACPGGKQTRSTGLWRGVWITNESAVLSPWRAVRSCLAL